MTIEDNNNAFCKKKKTINNIILNKIKKYQIF